MQKLSDHAYKNKINYINEYKKKNIKKITIEFQKDEAVEIFRIKNDLNVTHIEIYKKGLEELQKNQKK